MEGIRCPLPTGLLQPASLSAIFIIAKVLTEGRYPFRSSVLMLCPQRSAYDTAVSN